MAKNQFKFDIAQMGKDTRGAIDAFNELISVVDRTFSTLNQLSSAFGQNVQSIQGAAQRGLQPQSSSARSVTPIRRNDMVSSEGKDHFDDAEQADQLNRQKYEEYKRLKSQVAAGQGEFKVMPMQGERMVTYASTSAQGKAFSAVISQRELERQQKLEYDAASTQLSADPESGVVRQTGFAGLVQAEQALRDQRLSQESSDVTGTEPSAAIPEGFGQTREGRRFAAGVTMADVPRALQQATQLEQARASMGADYKTDKGPSTQEMDKVVSALLQGNATDQKQAEIMRDTANILKDLRGEFRQVHEQIGEAAKEYRAAREAGDEPRRIMAEENLRAYAGKADQLRDEIDRTSDQFTRMTGGGGGPPPTMAERLMSRGPGIATGIGVATGLATSVATTFMQAQQSLDQVTLARNLEAETLKGEVRQAVFQEETAAANMADPMNLLKYRADILFPDEDFRYLGQGGMKRALDTATLNEVQLRDIQRRARAIGITQGLGNVVTGSAEAVMGGAIGMTGGPLGMGIGGGMAIGGAGKATGGLGQMANAFISSPYSVFQGQLDQGLTGVIGQGMHGNRFAQLAEDAQQAEYMQTLNRIRSQAQQFREAEAKQHPGKLFTLEQRMSLEKAEEYVATLVGGEGINRRDIERMYTDHARKTGITQRLDREKSLRQEDEKKVNIEQAEQNAKLLERYAILQDPDRRSADRTGGGLAAQATAHARAAEASRALGRTPTTDMEKAFAAEYARTGDPRSLDDMMRASQIDQRRKTEDLATLRENADIVREIDEREQAVKDEALLADALSPRQIEQVRRGEKPELGFFQSLFTNKKKVDAAADRVIATQKSKQADFLSYDAISADFHNKIMAKQQQTMSKGIDAASAQLIAEDEAAPMTTAQGYFEDMKKYEQAVKKGISTDVYKDLHRQAYDRIRTDLQINALSGSRDKGISDIDIAQSVSFAEKIKNLAGFAAGTPQRAKLQQLGFREAEDVASLRDMTTHEVAFGLSSLGPQRFSEFRAGDVRAIQGAAQQTGFRTSPTVGGISVASDADTVFTRLQLTPGEYMMRHAEIQNAMNISKAEVGRGNMVSRAIGMARGGMGSFDSIVSNLGSIADVAGGGEQNMKRLETVMSQAVATGFNSSRMAQKFVQATTKLAESVGTRSVEAMAVDLATTSRYVGLTQGKSDALSLRLAEKGIADFAAFTGQTGGTMGAMKFMGALGAGAGLGSGAGLLLGMNAIQMRTAQEDLERGRTITDPNVKRLIAVRRSVLRQEGVAGAELDSRAREDVQEQLRSTRQGAMVMPRSFMKMLTGSRSSIEQIKQAGSKRERSQMIEEFIANAAESAVSMDQSAESGAAFAVEELKSAGQISAVDANRAMREFQKKKSRGMATFKDIGKSSLQRYIDNLLMGELATGSDAMRPEDALNLISQGQEIYGRGVGDAEGTIRKLTSADIEAQKKAITDKHGAISADKVEELAAEALGISKLDTARMRSYKQAKEAGAQMVYVTNISEVGGYLNKAIENLPKDRGSQR